MDMTAAAPVMPSQKQVQADLATQLKIEPGDVVPVEIESGNQPWCDLYLKDGVKIRIQLTVFSVHKVPKMVGDDGLPKYAVNAGFITQAFPRKQRK